MIFDLIHHENSLINFHLISYSRTDFSKTMEHYCCCKMLSYSRSTSKAYIFMKFQFSNTEYQLLHRRWCMQFLLCSTINNQFHWSHTKSINFLLSIWIEIVSIDQPSQEVAIANTVVNSNFGDDARQISYAIYHTILSILNHMQRKTCILNSNANLLRVINFLLKLNQKNQFQDWFLDDQFNWLFRILFVKIKTSINQKESE